jgi:hypothetical protein
MHRLGWQGPVWQRSFHDHALRSGEDPAQAALYVVNNAVRRGLVDEWQQYPYAWLHAWDEEEQKRESV